MTAEAQEKGITLSVQAAAGDLIVHGDAIRIEQIVWNLLNNAVKFTPAGGTVSVKLFQEDNTACLEVTDTGKGIPAEFLPSIFDMFRQADTGTARRYGGMGIGLALVKELTISHGGRVEAYSEGAGRGAQFRIFLPEALKRHAARKPASSESKGLAGKRILLVDDLPEMLESLGELLVSEGAEVTRAQSGEHALMIVQGTSDEYDLIISDIGMPGMDGYSLLAELRKVAATATTPAIALSGFTRPVDVEHALEAGFEAHVRKPVVFDQFISIASRLSR
jgi:two-component system CheB/CheR fusion protein